jgi:hypothetical protein
MQGFTHSSGAPAPVSPTQPGSEPANSARRSKTAIQQNRASEWPCHHLRDLIKLWLELRRAEVVHVDR